MVDCLQRRLVQACIPRRHPVLGHAQVIAELFVIRRDIYERPVKRFTAGFVGENNLLDGRIAGKKGEKVTLDLGFATVQVGAAAANVTAGDEATISIRSELLVLLAPAHEPDDQLQRIPAIYVEEVYLGLTTSYLVRLPNGIELMVRRITKSTDDAPFTPGEAVMVGWRTISSVPLGKGSRSIIHPIFLSPRRSISGAGFMFMRVCRDGPGPPGRRS